MYNMNAMLVSRSLNYKGIIKDFSDDGICIHIHADQNICELLNGMLFVVNFVPPSGEKIDLQCKVIRIHGQIPNALENIVGMKILETSQEYREFLKTLH